MTRQTTRALALCLSAILAACGGGQDPASSTSTERAATVPATETTLSTPSTGTGPTVSAATSQAWAESASLNRAEVQQAPEAVESDAAPSTIKVNPKAITAPSAAIYRFYNINTGAHLFTRDVTERDRTLNTLAQFRYEGPVFSAWQSADTGLSPVYRFYNTTTSTHFFTISEAEKNSIVATQPSFQLEGPAYYASKTAQTDTTPLFRFYNLQRGFHFYTASAEERDSIIANLGAVYHYEGVGYYVNASIGNYNRALASFVGKANTPGRINASGEDARFLELRSIAFDTAGSLYVSEGRFVDGVNAKSNLKKVSPAGWATDFVGNVDAYGSQDGIGSGATFHNLKAVTIDAAGNAYVGDQSTIRKITPSGAVSTIAGHLSETGNVDGQSKNSRFRLITGIVIDSAGNIFVSDSQNNSIRKLSTTGVVTTFAGAGPNLNGGGGYADGVGNAAYFSIPSQLAIDASDNLYVADQYNHRIRKITPAGLVTTLAGQSSFGVADGQGSAARFDRPYAIAVDKATGDVYTSDWRGFTLRRITPSGNVTTVVGTAYIPGVFFGSLPAGLAQVGGLAIQGDRIYIASLYGIYWTNLPQ